VGPCAQDLLAALEQLHVVVVGAAYGPPGEPWGRVHHGAGAMGWRHENQAREPEGKAPEPVPQPRGRASAAWVARALVANAVLLALAGVAAIALLVVVLTQS
jgi:hypothetical protein